MPPLKNFSLQFKNNFLDEDNNRLNDEVLNYFKEKLLAWKESLHKEREENLNHILITSIQEPDPVDLAKADFDRNAHFTYLEQEKEILEQIDAALERIEKGIYGFCEETGKLIDLNRLEAWPVARFINDIQEKHENEDHLKNDV